MAKKEKDRILKTNAARLLDRAGVAYRLVPYPVDEQHLEATHVAEALGEDIRQVYKTLVLRAGKQLLVCVIPGAEEVDLKKAARAIGAKKAEMIHVRELLPLTGYIRGGCSPVGMKQKLPTFIQRDCLQLEEMYVSAGQRGLQFAIAPRALIDFTGATPTDLISDNGENAPR